MDHSYIEEHNIADLYLMGRLPDDVRAQFELHFINCDQCVDQLEEVSDFRDVLRAPDLRGLLLPRPRLIARLLSWLTFRGALLQAAIVTAPLLLLALTALFFNENRRLRHEIDQANAKQEQIPSLPQSGGEPPIATNQEPEVRDNKPIDRKRGNQKPETLPQVNTAIFVLSAVRGAGETTRSANEITLSDSPEWFVISIGIEDASRYTRYRATVFDADNKVVWRNSSLVPNAYDAFTIGFNSTFFKARDYVLVLEGLSSEGQSSPIANYPFRIVKKNPVK